MADDPTRVNRPPDHGPDDPGRPSERETVYEEGDRGWFAQLTDRLESLRTGLAIVAVVAVAGLAVGLISLLGDDESESAGDGGASPARVQGLEDRLDEFEERLGNRAGENAVSDLESTQQELADRIDSLEQSVEGGGDQAAAIDDLNQSVEELQQALADLEQRVEDLEEQEQNEQPAP